MVYPSEYTKLNEYIIDANGIQTTFLLKNNYVTPKYLGGGAQGRVIGARDKMNNQKVAIKQVRYSTESEFIDIQEEISILFQSMRRLRPKSNILSEPSLETPTFSGLRSLCTIPSECR